MHEVETAMHFLQKCENEEDLAALIVDFTQATVRHGCCATAIGAWIGEGKNRLHRFYFNDWPEELRRLHHGDEDCVHDPIVIEASRTMRPFLWTGIRGRVHSNPHEQAIIEGFERAGWRDVFAIPVHGPAGYVGLVALAAKHPLQLTVEKRAALEMMALGLHHRCHQTEGFGDGLVLPRLTSRQIECMRLVLAGRSDVEIAELLGVSTSTAHFHIEAAKARLGARSRAHAAAMLSLAGRL